MITPHVIQQAGCLRMETAGTDKFQKRFCKSYLGILLIAGTLTNHCVPVYFNALISIIDSAERWARTYADKRRLWIVPTLPITVRRSGGMLENSTWRSLAQERIWDLQSPHHPKQINSAKVKPVERCQTSLQTLCPPEPFNFSHTVLS